MVNKVLYLFRSEASGGIFLVIAAVLAMLIANSPLKDWYNSLLEIPVVFSIGTFVIDKGLLLWVNDGLMALFFFLVGLEIKREVLNGQLSDAKQLVLPLIAAVAGIVVPALIYLSFNSEDPIAANGWAIPSATDIAFALGVFVIFGKYLPLALKLFLLAVAIFDDIAAVVRDQDRFPLPGSLFVQRMMEQEGDPFDEPDVNVMVASMTTLRPLGPRVTATASVRASTPASRAPRHR